MKKYDDCLDVQNLDIQSRDTIFMFFDQNKRFLDKKAMSIISPFIDKIISLRKYLLEQRDVINKQLNYMIYEKEIFKLLDCFFDEARSLEQCLSSDILKSNFKKLFRTLMKEILFQSNLIKYSSEKPRGYPGDFRIIETIYNNTATSSGFSLLLDKYMLQNIYAKAIRCRKDTARQILKENLEKNENIKSAVKILNLACGPCREVRELLSNNFKVNKDLAFYMVDQDEQALQFARTEICKFKTDYKFNYYRSDVIKYLKDVQSNSRGTGFDLIYCIGLADYLPDSVLVALMNAALRNLKNGGRFILAHKNTKLFHFTISDWAADWKFIPRNYEDLVNLIKHCDALEGVGYQVLFKKDMPILFLQFSKD